MLRRSKRNKINGYIEDIKVVIFFWQTLQKFPQWLIRYADGWHSLSKAWVILKKLKIIVCKNKKKMNLNFVTLSFRCKIIVIWSLLD